MHGTLLTVFVALCRNVLFSRYPNGDEVEYVVTVFDCEVVGGSFIDSHDETRTLEYFRREEMPALAFEYPAAVFDRNRAEPHFGE